MATRRRIRIREDEEEGTSRDTRYSTLATDIRPPSLVTRTNPRLYYSGAALFQPISDTIAATCSRDRDG